MGFPGGTGGEEPAYQRRRRGFEPWVGKMPRRRAWPPTPVLLPGESHGQRSLAGYSPWGRRESDTTEQLNCNKLFPLRLTDPSLVCPPHAMISIPHHRTLIKVHEPTVMSHYHPDSTVHIGVPFWCFKFYGVWSCV